MCFRNDSTAIITLPLALPSRWCRKWYLSQRPLRRAGKSNSGEGGEDPVRWDVMQNVDADGVSPSLPHLKGLQNGDMATSRIKQVHLTCPSLSA